MAAVADKSSKSAPKTTVKVFDVSKPNKQPASATSRPVIVPNRPIMQDPMMTPDKNTNSETLPDNADEKSPSSVKVTIQPPAEKSEIKDETPMEAQTPSEKPVEVTVPTEAPEDAAEEAKPAEVDAPAPEEDPKPVEPAEPAASTAAATGDELPISDQTLDEKQTAELEAAAKKQAELDTLVESKEFFLPINAVERRRSKLMTLLGVVLIVGLGLLLVDMMLDAGFIHIPGVNPLTHFFSS